MEELIQEVIEVDEYANMLCPEAISKCFLFLVFFSSQIILSILFIVFSLSLFPLTEITHYSNSQMIIDHLAMKSI